MAKSSVVIISPALANANNGNWQTAYRWLRFLRSDYRVMLTSSWDGTPADFMIALHARRSAASIAAFSSAYPERPLIVVLTGTDLYRDIANDSDAQRSLQLATALVVLQQSALQAVPPAVRHKAAVIYQSAPAVKPVSAHRTADPASITMVAHLREEKNPGCFMEAAGLIQSPRIRMHQIGGALDPHLAQRATATQQTYRHYRWLGNMSHTKTRRFIRRSHLLVLPSKMEGGANVIIEAVMSGVPVLASNISGNRGMLGDDYAGYFPADDSTALAYLLERSVEETRFYETLRKQCEARAPLFSPARERTAVLQLLDNVRHCIQELS